MLHEDYAEYERLLDEALRTAPSRPDLAPVGQWYTPQRLRAMALDATAVITVAAATEYQHYVKIREELRHPAPTAASYPRESGRGKPGPGRPATGTGAAAGPAGAGMGAVVAVLAPVLTGTAAAIFLLVGYILKMLDPEPAFARSMVTVGWVSGAVTAAAILIAAVGLLLTAVRNRHSPTTGPDGEQSHEVAQAREAWRKALLERGILPFLREAHAHPRTATAPHHTPPTGRIPHTGYSRPGFASPDYGSSPGPRPRYSSPDYTSPDFGGPDHQPE
ncbi:hypothetical protein [Streptomyces sp. NPDC055189]